MSGAHRFETPGTAFSIHAGICSKTAPTYSQFRPSLELRICTAPPDTASSPVEKTYHIPLRPARTSAGSWVRRSPVSVGTDGLSLVEVGTDTWSPVGVGVERWDA